MILFSQIKKGDKLLKVLSPYRFHMT